MEWGIQQIDEFYLWMVGYIVTNIDCDYATVYIYIFTIDYWYSIVWLVSVSGIGIHISLMVFENYFNNGATGHI